MILFILFVIFAQVVSSESGFNWNELSSKFRNIKPSYGAMEWTYVEETFKCYSPLDQKKTYVEAENTCQSLDENYHSDIATVDEKTWILQYWMDTEKLKPSNIFSSLETNFICQTDAVGVNCGFWGHEYAPSCSYCGIGPKECGGECFWKENAQACIPLKMSHIPEAYTVSSDGITGQRYPQLMGTYVLSQYVDDCPLEPTYLLYIHQDDPHKLLAGDSDGWVIGDDWGLWVGYLRTPPTTDSILFPPKENWSFRYTSKTESGAFMNDSSISVLPSNLYEMEAPRQIKKDENDDADSYDSLQNSPSNDDALDIEYDALEEGEAKLRNDMDCFEFEEEIEDYFAEQKDEEDIYNWVDLIEKETNDDTDEAKLLMDEILKEAEVSKQKLEKLRIGILAVGALGLVTSSVWLMLNYFKLKRNATSTQNLPFHDSI